MLEMAGKQRAKLKRVAIIKYNSVNIAVLKTLSKSTW